MSAPKVLFENYISDTNVEVDSYVSPHDIYGAVNTLSYEYWEFDTDDATIDIEYTGTVNCFGIVIQDLLNCTITVYYSSDDIIYTQAVTKNFIRNGAHMISFDDVWGNYFRIVIEKAVSSNGIVKNIMLGEYLEFERCLMRNHAPIPFNRNTDFISNQSGTGRFLGRSSRGVGNSNSFDFQMLTSSWGRNQFQTFVESCQNKAYYIAWNDELYPDESAFGWTDEDIPLSYTGDASLMETRWTMRALPTSASDLDNSIYLLSENGELLISENNKFLLSEASP